MSRAPLAEASDEKTSERRLAALAKEHASDLEVMAAIARHPNTAPRVLLEVAVAVPTVAVKHPAFVLQAIGGAASFAKFPAATVIAVLAHGVAPPELLRWVEGMRASWGSADHNRQELFRAALRIGRGEAPPKHENVLREVAIALSRSAALTITQPDAIGEVFFAHYVHASEEALARVLGAARIAAQLEAVAMLEGLGSHPRATAAQVAAVLDRLVSLQHGNIRMFGDVESCSAVAEKVLSRADITAEDLRRWASLPTNAGEGRDAVVRGALRVAIRRGLLAPDERAALLGRELTARLALVTADRLSEIELAALASDADYRVRARVAARSDVSAEILSTLATDEVLQVTEAALANASVSEPALRAALSHPRRAVRRAAAAATPPPLLADVAERLLQDPDGLTRLAVANRRDAPQALLSALARDKSPTIRRAIAKNVSTPKAVLDLLASDASPRVLDGLKKRPKPKAS